jgi:Flp pilus assembly pilin Flp
MLEYLRLRWQCLRSRARGAATAEYALLLTLVVVVLIGVLTELGAVLVQRVQEIVMQLGGA